MEFIFLITNMIYTKSTSLELLKIDININFPMAIKKKNAHS